MLSATAAAVVAVVVAAAAVTVLLLAAAFISFLLSVTLWFSGFKDEGLYVGLWEPSILAFGSFIKQNYK